MISKYRKSDKSRRIFMLSNRSRGTLMSHSDRSVQSCFKSNTPESHRRWLIDITMLSPPQYIPRNPSHANTVFGKKMTCFLRVLKLALDLSIYICSNILILYIIATICTHEHYSSRLFLTAGAGLQATFSCVFQSIS